MMGLQEAAQKITSVCVTDASQQVRATAGRLRCTECGAHLVVSGHLRTERGTARTEYFYLSISAYNFDSHTHHFVGELEGSGLTSLVCYVPDKNIYF